MSDLRPSGFRLAAASAASVLLTIPISYPKPAVVRDLQAALLGISSGIALSQSATEPMGSHNIVVALDGWGQLTLSEALVAFQTLFPGVPTLALSTDRQLTVATLLNAGFSDSMEWPSDSAELRARVRARLQLTLAHEPAVIVVDPARLTVRCNRVLLRLTRGEFELLSTLLKAPGAWLSQKSLQDARVRPRSGGTSVAARIHTLRKKLEHEAWRLRSHRTLGYLFETSPVPTLYDVYGKGS